MPARYKFIRPTDEEWWIEDIERFQPAYRPCNVIRAQRIPPFPEAARRYITDRYCAPQIKKSILESKENKDCLIRPYLGRKRIKKAPDERPSRFHGFSLRNYPLHLDQMEDLDIPKENILGYARAMVDALAILHWYCEVDGNDIEYVLAPPDENIESHSLFTDQALGTHIIWMLDFDLVRNMAMDTDGVN